MGRYADRDAAKRLLNGWILESPDTRTKKFRFFTGFLTNKGITWVKDGVTVPRQDAAQQGIAASATR